MEIACLTRLGYDSIHVAKHCDLWVCHATDGKRNVRNLHLIHSVAFHKKSHNSAYFDHSTSGVRNLAIPCRFWRSDFPYGILSQ